VLVAVDEVGPDRHADARVLRDLHGGADQRLVASAFSLAPRAAFGDALDFLRVQLTIAFSTEDIQEGVKALFERREPQWTGR
jgi:enoyl-CoA hydratase/carnithine racemase